MICSGCGGRNVYVVDSRPGRLGRCRALQNRELLDDLPQLAEAVVTMRRHRCETCGARWNTVELPMPILDQALAYPMAQVLLGWSVDEVTRLRAALQESEERARLLDELLDEVVGKGAA